MGAEDEPLDGRGDTGRAEGRGEAGWRVADGDGGEQGGLQVLQGGGGVAVGAPPRWRLSIRPQCNKIPEKIPLVFGISMGYNYLRLASKKVR